MTTGRTDSNLKQLAPFVERQCTGFTRGASHYQPVRALADLVFDESGKSVVIYRLIAKGGDQRRIRTAQEVSSEGDHDRPSSARLVSKPAWAPRTTTGSFICSCHSSDSMAMLSGWS